MKGGSKEFGEYLIGLRDARKQTDPTFSMRGVANKIGISPTYLNKIERGEQPASDETIRKLAEVFDVSADEIFAHAERIDPNLEKTLAGHEAPAQMAAFLRRVATLPPKQLEIAERIIDAIDIDKDGSDKEDKGEKKEGTVQ
ncbi:MAG: helix-turn-helix transcriptional regulator [Victivallales bacterium]|nr:helix-turn-helix transcriptional regulator [Victivallales bacterium]